MQARMDKKAKVQSIGMLLKSTIYTTTEEFVNHNTKFEALVLDNFKTLFATYFIICLVIFIAFVFEHCYHRLNIQFRFFNLITRELTHQ